MNHTGGAGHVGDTGTLSDVLKARARALLLVAACAVPLGGVGGGAVTHAEPPSFQGLGDLPGGAISSEALGISPDGSVVVGDSDASLGRTAFRWTAADGMTGLGVLSPSTPDSFAECVGRDNTTIFGGSSVNPSCGLFPYNAFSWTSAGGMVDAGTALCGGGCCTSNIAACSEDGTVRAGSGLVNNEYRPLINKSDGTWLPRTLVGHTGPGAFRGISASGNVAVGAQWTTLAVPGFPLTPLAWAGADVFPISQNHLQAEAEAASADGSIIVGFDGRDQSNDCEAAVWTNFGTPVLLGDLPGGARVSKALAVTPDARLIGGFGTTTDGAEAFLWDQTHGMRRFQDVLSSIGVSTTGWRLTSIAAFSADGTVVVGTGINPSGNAEGWRAVLSCFPGCIADFDGSGGTPDASDIEAFFLAWLTGDSAADADCSGGTPDAGDIDVFFTAWLAGGC